MSVSVLVVDDSSFFQHRLAEMINSHPQLQVIAVAGNGRQAVEMAQQKKPDVITMDYEMPLMDGVTAVREIMASRPTPIIMFSSLTYEGAKVTLDALDAGAVDFLPKSFAEVSASSARLKDKLHQRLLAVARPQTAAPAEQPQANAVAKMAPGPSTTGAASVGAKRIKPAVSHQRAAPLERVTASSASASLGQKKILAIGSSTGGPAALAQILKPLPSHFPVPILLIQHMPESFTQAFAERLNSQCNIKVHLAKDGMTLAPGNAYLAPGGQQMMISPQDKSRIKILPGDDRLNYKPSVDVTFASVANVYQSSCLAMVLTGMGRDGCQGCRVVKEHKGSVWSQDQASSVIYGMPMAVAEANLTDKVIGLNEIARSLKDAFRC